MRYLFVVLLAVSAAGCADDPKGPVVPDEILVSLDAADGWIVSHLETGRTLTGQNECEPFSVTTSDFNDAVVNGSVRFSASATRPPEDPGCCEFRSQRIQFRAPLDLTDMQSVTASFRIRGSAEVRKLPYWCGARLMVDRAGQSPFAELYDELFVETTVNRAVRIRLDQWEGLDAVRVTFVFFVGAFCPPETSVYDNRFELEITDVKIEGRRLEP